MLTGDKIETAKCIAISAGLKSIDQDIFEIRNSDQEDTLSLHNKIVEFSNRHNTVLLIDGDALAKILLDYEEFFFKIAKTAPTVVCCRCLPT